jgi:hypothetical protein
MTFEPKIERDQFQRVAVVVGDHHAHVPRVRGRRARSAVA